MYNSGSTASGDIGTSASGPLARGPFYYWSENGTGPHVLIEVLRKYYTELAGGYMNKGMVDEAKVFAEVAEEFKKMERKILELSHRIEGVQR